SPSSSSCARSACGSKSSWCEALGGDIGVELIGGAAIGVVIIGDSAGPGLRAEGLRSAPLRARLRAVFFARPFMPHFLAFLAGLREADFFFDVFLPPLAFLPALAFFFLAMLSPRVVVVVPDLSQRPSSSVSGQSCQQRDPAEPPRG